MALKTFLLKVHSAYRYVSPHQAHRTRSALFALIFLVAAAPLLGEESKYAGTAAELARETRLFDEADPNSETVGKLPKGTIVILTGERAAGFSKIEVELEGGRATGWVSDKVIRIGVKNPPERSQDPDTGALETETIKRKKSRSSVPEDEVLLLKREPSFLYGLYAGLHYALVDVAALQSPSSGFGFHFGGQFGIFAGSRVPITLEVGYSQLGGSNAEDLPVSLGVFDVGVNALYLLTPSFEAIVGLRYAFGSSILDLPASVALDGPSDFSSVWLVGGAGYRLRIGAGVDMVLRGTYSFSFSQNPVGFHKFGFTSLLEVRG